MLDPFSRPRPQISFRCFNNINFIERVKDNNQCGCFIFDQYVDKSEPCNVIFDRKLVSKFFTITSFQNKIYHQEILNIKTVVRKKTV